MSRWVSAALLVSFAIPSSAIADLQTDEAWLKTLRGSGSYREGMANVDRLVTAAYDIGAIAGASHWEDVHAYYTALARKKGCETGKPYAEGPVKACHVVSGPEPKIIAKDYRRGKSKTVELAAETTHPDLVRRVLLVLYDYGYVQGLKHGLRTHNDDIVLAQTYYRSCMSRANAAKGEPVCAKASKTWSDALLGRLSKRIEGHLLAAEKKP